MTRFFDALLIALVAGCGGEITVGTLAAKPDAGSGSDSPPSACASSTGPEVLHDTKANNEENVTDFFGDGDHVFAGINYIGDFRAGRIATFPSSVSAMQNQLVDVSPMPIERLLPALDRMFFTIGPRGEPAPPGGNVGFSPRSGGTPTMGAESAAPVSASHPERSEIFFLREAPDPKVGVQILAWDPPAAPTPAFKYGLRDLRVFSMSVSPSVLAALVRDDAAGPRVQIVRPNQPEGAALFEEIASFDAASSDPGSFSNVVVDGDDVYVAIQEANTYVIHRFDGLGTHQAATGATKVATVPVPAAYGARLEVDATHVYLSYQTAVASCEAGAFCAAPLDVVRADRAGGSAPALVKSFTGVLPRLLQYRAFNVDACWFYWYDAAAQVFQRQAKASL